MEELMKFNPYNVSIEYNAHKTVHTSIVTYYDQQSFIDLDECVKQDRVFSIRVYPLNSVGFYEVCASDYKTALQKMCEILEEELPKTKIKGAN